MKWLLLPLGVLPLVVVLVGIGDVAVGQEPRKIEVRQPLTAGERAAAARLTRRPTAQLWWNPDNRVVGAAFKGADANDQTVALAGQLPGLRSLVLVPFPDTPLTDDGLAALAKLSDLELVSISGNHITDAGLAHLGRLSRLRALILHAAITDAGLPYLADLPDLEQLDLSQSRVTDEGLTQLRSLPRLTTLILNGTRVTNQGVARIAEIKTITHLYLGMTELDDSAVEWLATMEQLSVLAIQDTRITSQGIATLISVLPENCQIIHQSGRFRGTRTSPIAMATIPSAPAAWRPVGQSSSLSELRGEPRSTKLEIPKLEGSSKFE
jgi:hypothetical protein